jgi:hypothetical protein
MIEMVDEVMRAYEYTPASEAKLTRPSEVLQAIMELLVGKAPGPNGIPKTVLRHLPKRLYLSPPQAILPTSTETHSHAIHQRTPRSLLHFDL